MGLVDASGNFVPNSKPNNPNYGPLPQNNSSNYQNYQPNPNTNPNPNPFSNYHYGYPHGFVPHGSFSNGTYDPGYDNAIGSGSQPQKSRGVNIGSIGSNIGNKGGSQVVGNIKLGNIGA